MTPQIPGRLRPLLGMVRLARGRVDGLEQFGDTPQFLIAHGGFLCGSTAR